MLAPRLTEQNGSWWHGQLIADDIRTLQQHIQLPDMINDQLQAPYPELTFKQVDDTTYFVLDMIVDLTQDHQTDTLFLAIPVSFILQPGRCITLVPQEVKTADMQPIFSVIEQALPQYMTNQSIVDFLTAITEASFRDMHAATHQLNRIGRHDEAALTRNQSMSKRLNRLSRVRASLVQLDNSLRGNIHMLSNDALTTPELTQTITFGEHIQQHLQMNREMVDNIYKTYQSFWDERLNKTMKELTIAGLVFAIPPIISGFYGQNVTLPLAKDDLAWLWTLLMTGSIFIALLIWLWRQDYFK
jgi:Mg2+ and Co2+ transporter CorA